MPVRVTVSSRRARHAGPRMPWTRAGVELVERGNGGFGAGSRLLDLLRARAVLRPLERGLRGIVLSTCTEELSWKRAGFEGHEHVTRGHDVPLLHPNDLDAAADARSYAHGARLDGTGP